MRSILVASGKGGVGKSTIALNLGLVLSQAGKKVIVVDTDFSMANIGLMLGIERTPITIHHVLMGENDVRDAIYEGPDKLKYVPSGLSLEKVSKFDYDKLKEAIHDLEELSDFVIIDTAPGMGEEVKAAIKSAKEIILVVTPDAASLADALKVKTYADRNNINLLGVVENMVIHDKSEIKKDDIQSLMDLKVIAEIPEDKEVRKSTAMQIPVVIRARNAPFSKSIVKLAAVLTGEQIETREANVKKSFIQKIIESIKAIFKR